MNKLPVAEESRPAAAMPSLRSHLRRHPLALFIGSALVLGAVLVSSPRLEQAFGRVPHSLAWGPALFRVLLAGHGLALILAGLLIAGDGAPEWNGTPRRDCLILAGLTLLAALLSLPSLNSCLWLDEVLALVHYARLSLGWIFTSYSDQNQHMLYSLLAHCCLRLFGEQAWALRLPAVVFGAASVPALFLLGRRLLGAGEALAACALLTVSYHRIWFAQNARGYTGLLCLTLLATWFWLEALESNRWRAWLGYSACVALGMWIHMTMLFVAAAHALIFLVVWVRSGRSSKLLGRAAAAFALCGTLSLQIYALSLPEFFRGTLATAPGTASATVWTNPWWTLAEALRSLRVGSAAIVVVVLGGAMFAAGWIRILRRQARAAWAMVLPAAFTAAAMLGLEHCIYPRFFFFSAGFGLLILIHGALLAARWRPLAGYALAGLMIAASALTVPRCYKLPKQDFLGARDYVERRRAPDEPVIALSLASHAYTEYYAPSWPAAWSAAELDARRGSTGRAFVVYTLPEDLRAFHPDLWTAVHTDFETLKIFPGTLGGGEVYVCRERPRPGGQEATPK